MDDNQILSSLPEPEVPTANREIRDVYLCKEQAAMLELVRQYQILELFDMIERMEKDNSPSPRTSRILRNPNWRESATFLIAQLDPKALESVLDMTLPQRQPPDQQNMFQHANANPTREALFRTPKELPRADQKEPVIYTQFLADRNGAGLTCDEYEKFLDAMEVGARLRREDEFEGLRPGVVNGIETIFRRYQGNKSFYASLPGLYAMTTFQGHVRDFVRANRAMLRDARQKGANHIMTKPEAGWSLVGDSRCKEHRSLAGGSTSPSHMRLAYLALQHQFPQRGFRYHQYFLFDVVATSHAEIGESMASQLCCSYSNYGGFNVTQAGKSVNSANDMNDSKWSQMMSEMEAAELTYFDRVPENLRSIQAKYVEPLGPLQDRQKLIETMEQAECEASEHDFLEALVTTGTSALSDTVHEAEKLICEVESEFKQADDDEARLLDSHEALRELFVELRERVPATQNDT